MRGRPLESSAGRSTSSARWTVRSSDRRPRAGRANRRRGSGQRGKLAAPYNIFGTLGVSRSPATMLGPAKPPSHHAIFHGGWFSADSNEGARKLFGFDVHGRAKTRRSRIYGRRPGHFF